MSITNPSERRVVVTNAKGIVCWDLEALDSQGCGGPPANGGAVGAGFLAEDKPAGALIIRTRDGRTWFSVNGRCDIAFKDNKGLLRV